jgi:hypothetical protein
MYVLENGMGSVSLRTFTLLSATDNIFHPHIRIVTNDT